MQVQPSFEAPLPRQPPPQAMAAAHAQVATALRLVRDATCDISALNCAWIRSGLSSDPRLRAAAQARWRQSSRSLAGANCNLAVLQRAHAISLYTELHTIMKRKVLHAAALQRMRDREQLRAQLLLRARDQLLLSAQRKR